MTADFEIDILNWSGSQNERKVGIPKSSRPVGTIKAGDVAVHIRRKVFDDLQEYSEADINNERGSIFIGDYTVKGGVLSVIISDYIEAKYAVSKSATLTFTHETWNYVSDIKEKDYADKRIIGWHHTHPGYGVYLSAYDMFIQNNFFNLPFQVAYVIDPVNRDSGFFQWKNGLVERVNGFYIYE